ncbi:MAG: DUF501 domain-containing protein [Gaiellaceae bacterium]
MDDRSVIAAQLGREPRAFLRVAYRCPFGFPAVTEQKPYDKDGKPFPTGFYLTCPHLVASVARLEAAGAVERWSEATQRSRRLAWSLRLANRKQRRRRRHLARPLGPFVDDGASLGLGIAGVGNRDRLKCLHAHVAFALANPGYKLGELIAGELQPLWPTRCRSRSKGCRSRTKPPVGGSDAKDRRL